MEKYIKRVSVPKYFSHHALFILRNKFKVQLSKFLLDGVCKPQIRVQADPTRARAMSIPHRRCASIPGTLESWSDTWLLLRTKHNTPPLQVS